MTPAVLMRWLAGAECPELTTAVVGTTQDLATLCGIAAADQPCRTANGVSGVCVSEEDCTGTPTPPDVSATRALYRP